MDCTVSVSYTHLASGYIGNTSQLETGGVASGNAGQTGDLETIDPLYLNAQGDKGNVMLAVVNPIIELNLSSYFKANMEVSYYYRHTHYSYHEDVKMCIRDRDCTVHYIRPYSPL